MSEQDTVFPTLEGAWKKAIKSLKGETINAVEIHWGHGTITLQQKTVDDPELGYKGWEIVEDE